MAPIWEQLADSLKDDRSIGIAKIDVSAEEGKLTGNQYGIKGFPSLKLIAKGELFDYKGGRDLASLKAYVQGGYSKDKSTKLPKDQTIIDHIQTFVSEYYNKIVQVAKFDVSIPVVFVLFGFLLSKLLDLAMPGVGISQARQIARDELAAEEKDAKKSK